ncbi:hypothetical protein B0H19DRAFT_1069486 [Mycena capillaripes]|nr:hypothetical protein B0H19DRAFT_1069486 [Mycena capillaripes]
MRTRCASVTLRQMFWNENILSSQSILKGNPAKTKTAKHIMRMACVQIYSTSMERVLQLRKLQAVVEHMSGWKYHLKRGLDIDLTTKDTWDAVFFHHYNDFLSLIPEKGKGTHAFRGTAASSRKKTSPSPDRDKDFAAANADEGVADVLFSSARNNQHIVASRRVEAASKIMNIESVEDPFGASAGKIVNDERPRSRLVNTFTTGTSSTPILRGRHYPSGEHRAFTIVASLNDGVYRSAFLQIVKGFQIPSSEFWTFKKNRVQSTREGSIVHIERIPTYIQNTHTDPATSQHATNIPPRQCLSLAYATAGCLYVVPGQKHGCPGADLRIRIQTPVSACTRTAPVTGDRELDAAREGRAGLKQMCVKWEATWREIFRPNLALWIWEEGRQRRKKHHMSIDNRSPHHTTTIARPGFGCTREAQAVDGVQEALGPAIEDDIEAEGKEQTTHVLSVHV